MRLGFDKFSVFTAAALLVAGIFAFSGTSFAADPAYCAQYARLALHENSSQHGDAWLFQGFRQSLAP